VNAHAIVVLVTDGHANVPYQTDDAWADALAKAGAIRCPALVIDTEDDQYPTGKPGKLAAAMRAACLPLSGLDAANVIRLIRDVA
jgi:Mg-chelatase subunit ChlD